MNAPAPARRKCKAARNAAIGMAVLVLLLLAGWYLTSARFQENMRRKLVAQLEQMTGGRVELGSFRWSLSRLEFEARDLTIHGLEAAGEAPYAHVDRLLVRLKILSLLRQQVTVRSLEVERPTVHIIVYPDGTTNQPGPARFDPQAADKLLFDIGIDRLEVARGALLWNSERLPLDFNVTGLAAAMTYVGPVRGYDARVKLDSVDTKYAELPSFHGKTDIHLGIVRDTIEMKSLKVVSEASTLEAQGSLTDFRDPTIEARYKGSFDAGELAGLMHMPELRKGRLEINGQGAYRGSEFTLTGRLVAKSLEWRDRSLRVPELSAAARYSITRDHIVLSDMTGQVFGGTVLGKAEITSWRAESGRRLAAKPAPQHGTAHIRLQRVQVGALAAAISTAKLPLDRINPAGAASGTVDVEWTGALRNADATFALDVDAPPNPSPQQLPVTAHVEGTYHGSRGIFEISQLNGATRTSRFRASGTLGSTTARLSVGLESTDLSELQPALAVFNLPKVPVEIHGHGSFTGSVIGKLTGPTITGHLEIFDFDSLFAASGAGGPGRMHWDSAITDLVYSPSELSFRRGSLRRGEAQARFQGTLGLHDGRFEDGSTIRGGLILRDAQVQDLQTLAGTNYPITGKLSMQLVADGTRHDPNAQGTLEIAPGSLEGEVFKSLRSAIRFSGQEAQLSNIVLVHNGAQVTGNLAYNFAQRGFRFDLRGSNFQLSKFQQLQLPRMAVAGVADFHLQGSGTTAAPVINVELHVKDMLLNKEPVGDFDLTGVTHGPDLHLSAHSHFQMAELGIEGDIRLRDDFPANVRLRFSQTDINPLLRALLQGRVTGHSLLAGTVDLRGPLRFPRNLNIVGNVDQFSAEIENVTVQSEGPVEFSLANELFKVERLHLKGFNRSKSRAGGAVPAPTTDLIAGGVIQLGGAHEMNFRANGVVDFGLLQSFNPDLTSSGTMEIDVAVRGTTARPETQGHVRISNGAVSYIDLPNGLSNINGTLVFNDNRLRVQSLTAQSGGGTLTLGGFVNYSRGLSFNLTATSKDIRLRYPPGISSSADADLRFSGTLKNSLLSGTITINKFNVSPQFDLAYYLGRMTQAPRVTNPDSPLNNLHFDLHIASARELQVEMSMAKLSGNADLRLRGTAGHPIVLGRVDIAQGNIDIAGTKYHLERGDLIFNNPTTIAPVIDVEATARVRDYDISLGVHGPMPHPSINYRSDPPLATSDIIALLALGRTQEEAMYYQTGPSQSLSELTSNAILQQALSSAYSSRAQRLFGVSRIKIDPQVGGAENNPNARVTIEQQVSDKVTLTFISNLSQSAQQIVQVEYNINRRLSVVAVRDQNGVLSFDVRYRQRKR